MLVAADIVNSSNHNAVEEEPILNSSEDKTSKPMEGVDIGKSTENVTTEIDVHHVPQTNVSVEIGKSTENVTTSCTTNQCKCRNR